MLINEQLSMLSNINLAFFGISITLFTVIYSFIITKRDEFYILKNKIIKGDDSPSTKLKLSFARSNIFKLKKINNHLLVNVILTFIIFLVSLFTEQLIKNESNNIIFLIQILFISEMIYFAYQMYRITKYYFSSTKL